MFKAFQKHLDTNFEFLKGKKLLVACSGGLDSVSLSFLLQSAGYEIGLAHCNFQLRGKESEADAEFVAELADKYDTPVYIENFETEDYAARNKLSIQVAARDLRYKWFEEIKADFNYDYVLTAHHADDNLETFLINLSRGTGIRGLTGIPPLTDHIVRPLLPFSRKQLLDFAKEEDLFWREDSSNKKTDYLRNAVRHKVIPAFKEHTDNLLKGFETTREHLDGNLQLMEDYMLLVRKLVMTEEDKNYIIDIPALRDLPNTDLLLYEMLHPFGFTAWKDIPKLLETGSGKYVLSETHRLLKDRNTLIISERSDSSEESDHFIPKLPYRTEMPISMNITEVEEMEKPDNNCIYVDKDTLVFPLQLRRWKQGDVFFPFGMKGKKKLSKYFKDEKLSLVAKENIWLLTSDDKIVWVVGHRPDDRFKVSPNTRSIVQIKCKP